MTAATATPPAQQDGRDLSLPRLYVLRLVYFLIAFGEGSQVIPGLFVHEPTARGMMQALLSGLCLMSALGLRYPREMLPLLMFEMAWKYIWFFAFGLPQYVSGQIPATFGEDFPAITFGVVIMSFVLPWGYMWRNFVKSAADPWRLSMTALSGFWRRGDQEVSPARLYALRAVALLAVYGLFDTVRTLFDHAPTDRGVVKALVSALWLMAFFAFRYPLKMIPIMLFELVWKVIWLIFFGLPQWRSGVGSPRLSEDLWSIGAFPIVVLLVIPWGYVWRHYVKQPGDRWR